MLFRSGRNDFLRAAAHTSYSIYSADGKLLQHVRNAGGVNDPNPALVKLPPGNYEVRADAEASGTINSMVSVPIRITAGATTVLHLDRAAKPRGVDARETVSLPDGSFVGFRAGASN